MEAPQGLRLAGFGQTQREAREPDPQPQA